MRLVLLSFLSYKWRYAKTEVVKSLPHTCFLHVDKTRIWVYLVTKLMLVSRTLYQKKE